MRRRPGSPSLTAGLAILTAAGWCACGRSTERPGGEAVERSPPAAPDLVEVRTLDPDVREDIRYYGSDNFVGARVDGYDAPKCLLSRPAAQALARIQAALEKEGYGLLVYDCYRPQRAVDDFVRWAEDTADVRTKAEHYPNVPKSRLFDEGYIAARSGHSRASTVDLTMVKVALDGTATPLDMGSPFDFFDPASHTDSPEVTPAQHANRLRLKSAMEAGGFTNYADEWWHYTLDGEPYPDTYFDVVVQ